MGQYGEIPVSLYTGIPNVGLSLFNVSSNHLSLPVSLSYHASAIKVEQLASNVGMNWSLNAGGVITREIRDEPDDAYYIKNRLACFSCSACLNCNSCSLSDTSVECISCLDRGKACQRLVNTTDRSPIGYLYHGQQIENLYQKNILDYTDEESSFLQGDELAYEENIMYDDITSSDIVVSVRVSNEGGCEDDVLDYLTIYAAEDIGTATITLAFITALNVWQPIAEGFSDLFDDVMDEYDISTSAIPFYTLDEVANFPPNIRNCLRFAALRSKYELKDTEPDIFKFNFNGISGRFAFDKDGIPQIFSDSDLKIEYNLSSDINLPSSDYAAEGLESVYGGAITEFTITTTDGVQYIFDTKEISVSNSLGQYVNDVTNVFTNYSDCSPPFINPYAFNLDKVRSTYTSWYLSEIKNPIGQKAFEFTYEDEFTIDHNGVNQQLTITKNELDEYINHVNVSSHVSIILGKRLKKVEWLTGTTFGTAGSLEFLYGHTRPDLYFPASTSVFSDNYSKGLTKIQWLDTNGTLIREAELEYGEFEETPLSSGCNNPEPWLEAHRSRLQLQSVTQRGRDESGNMDEKPPHEFIYNTVPLPPRHSAKQDFWGYYNGIAVNLIPHIYAYPNDTDGNDTYGSVYSLYERIGEQNNQEIVYQNFGNTNRLFNEAFAKAGTLAQIKYPTGGSTHFEFEGHDYLNNGLINNSGGGGIRIKSIHAFDGRENVLRKNYDYTKPIGQSNITSGHLVSMPLFIRHNGGSDEKLVTIFSRSINAGETAQGSAVVYEQVSEHYEGRGTSTSIFDVAIDFITEEADCDTSNDCIYERSVGISSNGSNQFPDNYPFPPQPNYDWNNGALLEQHFYDEASNPVRSIIYEYDIFGYKKIAGLKNVTTTEDVYYNAIQQTALGKYYLLSGDKRLVSETRTDYFPSGDITQTTSYAYGNNHRNPISITTNNSDGKSHKTEIDYAQEADVACLTNKHIISTPVEVRKYVNNVFQGGDRTEYFDFTTEQCLPRKHFSILHTQTNNEYDEVEEVYISDYTLDGFPDAIIRRGYPVRTFVWDDGLLESTTYGNQTQMFDYETGSRLRKHIQDIDGQDIFYDYDGLQRLSTISQRDGTITTQFDYEYGIPNKVTTTTTYADGTPTQTTEQRLDALGRAFKTFVNGVVKNEIFYATSGLVELQTHLPGNFMSMQYDGSPLNRLVATTYPGGTSVTQAYDSEEQYYKITTTDENGHSTSHLTDLIGRPYKTRNALNGETIWLYDDRNNNTRIISPEANGMPDSDGLNYIFSYDNRNRVKDKYIPGMAIDDQQNFTYYDGDDPSSPTYDPSIKNNLMETSIDPNETMVSYEYDVFGRPTISRKKETTDQNSIIISENRYDNDGVTSDPINIGRINQSKTLIIDSDPITYLTTDYSYDDYGRLHQTTKDNHIGGQDQVIHTYNDADWMTQNQRLHDSNASYGNENLDIIQNYEYDIFGRQTKNIYSINNTTRTLCTQTWNDRDQLVNKTLGDGLQSIDYAYNQRGWLRRINQPLALIDEPNPCNAASLSSFSNMMNDMFCGAIIADISEVLSIRFDPDVNLDCYNPCANSYLVAGTPADCPVGFSDNPPLPQALYVQTVQLTCPDGTSQDELRPDLSSFPTPTILYRIRFCNGEERYVFQAELNSLDPDTYLVLQETDINSTQQLFDIRESCGNAQSVGLDALVVLIAQEAHFSVNDYVIADICDPETPDCTEAEQQLQQEYINDLKAEGKRVEDFDFPLYLVRVLLCDGSEVYLSLDELQGLPGNYIELQRIYVDNEAQTFQVGSTFSSEDVQDLFYLSLHYEEADVAIENIPLYNGNISYMRWQVAGANEQIYKFTYDELDRITSATFGERGPTTLTFNDKYSSTYSNYDANGNIGRITRKGPQLPSFECAADIDDLEIDYTGNRISFIADKVSNQANRLRGFAATTSLPQVYFYDNNGNLVNDPHKGLAISYNYLNLPKLFDFPNEDLIALTHTSEGQKLQKAVTGTVFSLKDYCEGVEYKDRDLETVYHAEGRVVRNGGNWEFEWFIRDHLGSNRVVFKEGLDGLEILQQTHHYPFGAPTEGAWNTPQPTVQQDYLYNGKERTADYGLGWQDFGFRWALDGWMPVFSGVDPISEEFAHVSTYNYAENSPIANIDLHGLQALHYGATSSYTGEGQKFVENNPKTAAAIAIGFVAAPVLAVAGAEAGSAAVGSFLLNEAKDEALSQATGGASDILDLSKGLKNLVQGAIKKVDNALDKAISDDAAALIKGGAKGSQYIKWKGFQKGKLQTHYAKHGNEFGNITQGQYGKLAKEFAKETSDDITEKTVGKFIVKYDSSTSRVFVGRHDKREIRTFYKDDGRSGTPFQDAIDLAKQLSGL